MDVTFHEVVAVIAEMLRCDPGSITPLTTAPEIGGWDSLTHTRILLRLEEVFQIEFSDEQMFSARNVGELVALVEGLR